MNIDDLPFRTQDPTRRTNLRLPARLIEDLEVLARVRGTTPDEQLSRLLSAALTEPTRLEPPQQVAGETARFGVALRAWQLRELADLARAHGVSQGAVCATLVAPLARRLALAEPLVRGRLGYLDVLRLVTRLHQAHQGGEQAPA